MPSQSTLSKLKLFWLRFWGIIFFIGVTINFAEIICREFLNFSVDLMYDLPIWFTIWPVMMLAGPILPDGDHVSVGMIRDKLTGFPRKLCDLANCIMCIIFGAIVSTAGVLMISQYYDYNMMIIRSIPMPRWIVEMCIPLGMIMFTFFACVQLLIILRTKYTNTEHND